MHSVCLITASDRRGASATVTRALGLLELERASGSSAIVVTATCFRSNGTPHPGVVLEFQAILSRPGAARVARGRCAPDISGRCTFSYRLGISPAGYYGSKIVLVQDPVGVQAYQGVAGWPVSG